MSFSLAIAIIIVGLAVFLREVWNVAFKSNFDYKSLRKEKRDEYDHANR